MDPAIFSVSISLLIFGFTAGLSLDSIITRFYVEKMQGALQKGTTALFEKDKEIDNLKTELETVRKQYKELHDTIEDLKSTLYRVNHLPPPSSPLQRSAVCTGNYDPNFDLDELSSPYELNNTD